MVESRALLIAPEFCLVATISERVTQYLEYKGHSARVGSSEMSCSDHLTLALDGEKGKTMQQLFRPHDHVPDSHETL